MRTDLRVSYAEKDEAKRLGARWDSARKIWYVQNQPDLTPFLRWMSSATAQLGQASSDSSESGNMPHKSTHNGSDSGILVIGKNFVEQPQVCDCAPWEECEKCRSMALNGQM